MMNTDYDALWRTVTAQFACGLGSIHGPGHWDRVARIGAILAAGNGANPEVVRLFALLHDSRRLSDGEDPGHGARAASFAASLREQKFFELSDEHFRLLDYACRWHTDGRVSDNAETAVCWDADRLDLTRIQVKPRPEFMS